MYIIPKKNRKKNTEKKFRNFKTKTKTKTKKKEMRVPIELVRAILKMNEEFFFLVSEYSARLVFLNKIHAIPKVSTKETFSNDIHRIFILLPIVGSQKSFVLIYCWFTGMDPFFQQYWNEKQVNLLNKGVACEIYKYI